MLTCLIGCVSPACSVCLSVCLHGLCVWLPVQLIRQILAWADYYFSHKCKCILRHLVYGRINPLWNSDWFQWFGWSRLRIKVQDHKAKMKIFSYTCILQIFLYSYISLTFEYIILKVTWWLQQIWFHGMPYVSSSNENLNRVILVSYEEKIYNRAPKYSRKLPAFSLDGSGDSEALKETDEIDKDETTPQIAKTRRRRLDIDPTLLRWIGIYWTSIRGPCYLGTKKHNKTRIMCIFPVIRVNNKNFIPTLKYDLKGLIEIRMIYTLVWSLRQLFKAICYS